MGQLANIHLEGDEYRYLLHELENNLILEAEETISMGNLMANVYGVDQGMECWGFGYLGGGHFLVRAPEAWRQQVINQGFAEIGFLRFAVKSDLSEIFHKKEHREFWFRLSKVPYEMMGFTCLDKIVSEFGKLASVDADAISQTELRWARVLVVVDDISQFPKTFYYQVTTEYRGSYVIPILVELETEDSEPKLSIKLFEVAHRAVDISKQCESRKRGEFEMNSLSNPSHCSQICSIPAKQTMVFKKPGFWKVKINKASDQKCCSSRNSIHIPECDLVNAISINSIRSVQNGWGTVSHEDVTLPDFGRNEACFVVNEELVEGSGVEKSVHCYLCDDEVGEKETDGDAQGGGIENGRRAESNNGASDGNRDFTELERRKSLDEQGFPRCLLFLPRDDVIAVDDDGEA